MAHIHGQSSGPINDACRSINPATLALTGTTKRDQRTFVECKSGKTFPLYNPHTEEKVTDVSDAYPEDVDAAVRAAQRAFPVWSQLSTFQRVEPCLRLAELIERDQNELMRLDALTMGTPIALGPGHIQMAVTYIKYVCGVIHDIHGETTLHTPGYLGLTLLQPYGVCAGIAAWNASVLFFCYKTVSCVLAGNTIISKSSEKAPLVAIRLAALCVEAGFPPGVINVITGFRHISGAALASHMDIRKISFTGSTAAGKLVAAAAAKSNLKSVVLENGGKNAAVVFEDADLAKLKQFASIKIGDPTDPANNYGPQADKTQFEAVMRYINKCREAGAQLVLGGERASQRGYHIQPTVFVNVPEDSEIMKKEIFGAVAAIQSFATEEEVIACCNNTDYGLHASVFTRDTSRAIRVAKAFETGLVSVNCASPMHVYDLCFGGYKGSGLGRESGRQGLESWFEVKSVTMAV
ncbi:hypothetical protein BZG36_05324 [Bifiguratus adelaidae]|uniref:Aldehyde dehydrogenase domain-containing protein n=1 Tax=Bifiguratus adelaidae TaxID=1938954 RepID=A0A261XU99_9FUNG|nr:hypothetical protein BZG36_05324 [Bifiguratus adelaidae]